MFKLFDFYNLLPSIALSVNKIIPEMRSQLLDINGEMRSRFFINLLYW
ncbi:hypothetical protein [Nostoc sp. 2RC]|nr:hypothetical protein [Nostoc sp. 2RC]